MASGAFEDEAEGTVSINEYIESMDAEELVMILFFSNLTTFKAYYAPDSYESLMFLAF